MLLLNLNEFQSGFGSYKVWYKLTITFLLTWQALMYYKDRCYFRLLSLAAKKKKHMTCVTVFRGGYVLLLVTRIWLNVWIKHYSFRLVWAEDYLLQRRQTLFIVFLPTGVLFSTRYCCVSLCCLSDDNMSL